jgi:hypothetical protein
MIAGLEADTHWRSNVLVTNFTLKYRLYTIVTALYQLADVGRIHPMRERELRALKTSVVYIEA